MTDKTGISIYFDMTDIKNLTCKVLGTLDMYASTFLDPPAPLTKDATVRLVVGKFPLTDHTANDREKWTLELEEGQRVTGTLVGFTHDCIVPFLGTLGIPRFCLRLD